MYEIEVNQNCQMRSPEGEMMNREVNTSDYKMDVPAMPSSGECHDDNVTPSVTTCQPASGDDQELGVNGTRVRRRNGTVHSHKPSHRGKTPQDLTTPLKKWLYENRGNPYPTKQEKVALAVDSEMTLIQVTNWFANARRRLKNTVRKPGLTWSKRIKLFNKHASDTSDRLLGDGPSKDDTENHGLPNLHVSTPVVMPGWGYNHSWPIAPSTLENGEARLEVPPPPSPTYFPETSNSPKFKQTILHRYLSDSIEHQRNGYQPQTHRFANERTPPSVRCCESGSTSSYDHEDAFSCSPNSIGSDGNQTAFQDGCALYADYGQSYDMQGQGRWSSQHADVSYKTTDAEEIYWKEIIAAVVLTNMARAKLQQRPL
ncbi:homeobox protein Mohawk-like [Patiria miniata]|uniref:Homeobox domain-containing protein n=1 Tax=Patiria miniata TaxID=46514 RepID=A0A914BA08_PATMI|nr:homeobox protein Mohawk-like [Patiria miniata]